MVRVYSVCVLVLEKLSLRLAKIIHHWGTTTKQWNCMSTKENEKKKNNAVILNIKDHKDCYLWLILWIKEFWNLSHCDLIWSVYFPFLYALASTTFSMTSWTLSDFGLELETSRVVERMKPTVSAIITAGKIR